MDETTKQRQKVEGVLLMARVPLNSRRVAQLAGLEDGTQARTLIRGLNELYDRSGRAFQIKKVAGGYQLRTRPQFARWLRQLDHLPTPLRLTGPALETLAVVAYRQPITKADIEAVRGVSCGEMLRQLLDRGMVRIAGRSEHLGHPFLYATTRQFLTTFGLAGLDSLPRADNLREPGLPQWAASVQNPVALHTDPSAQTDQPIEENVS